MNKERRRERSRERREAKDPRRDLQSSSAAADKASRLRMDSYSDRNRSRPSPPRRKEIDNVMKKARRDGNDKSQFWNKKLLEVEEKDPNRWRHSGYKELYVERSSSSRSKSRSPVRRPPPKTSARARSPKTPPRSRRSRSRSPAKAKPRPASSRARPASPLPKSRRSPSRSSSSSDSSCSDDQCSVCSPKQTRRKAAAAVASKKRSRSRSFSVPRSRTAKASTTKASAGAGAKSSATIGRKPPPKPPVAARVEAARSARGSSPPRDPRQPSSAVSSVVTKPKSDAVDNNKRSKMLAAVKIEGQKRPPPPESDSEESSSSSEASGAAAPKMTLSERFGKMAQWSVDRRDVDYMKNMRITKDSNSPGFKVVIDGPDEEEPYRPAAPEFADRRIGAGYFPETMHAAPVGLSSWDDVRVRYKYYKGRGYLRDLSLDDYIKWEEWWYKYQEWLETERYYEQWAGMPRRRHRRFARKRSVSPLN